MNAATNVHVSGAEWPQWATETTLEKIKDMVEELRGLSERGQRQLERVARGVSDSGRKNVDALEENLSELVKETQKLGRVQGGITPEQRRFTTAKQFMTSSAMRLAGGLDSLYAQYLDQARSLGVFGRAGLGLSESFMELSSSTEEFSRSLSAGFALAAGAVGLITATLGVFWRVAMDSTNVLRDMNEIGLRQISTSVELRENLRELTMTSDQFGAVMTKYARAMGTFGEDSLARLVGRTTGLNYQFRALGITTAEAAEFAAEYLEQQRLRGIFDRQTEAVAQRAFVDHLQQLNQLSGLLNISRRQIQEQITAAARDQRIRAFLLGRQGTEAGDTIQEIVGIFTAIGADDLRETFLTLVSAFGDPATALGELGALPGMAPELVQSLLELARGAREGVRTLPTGHELMKMITDQLALTDRQRISFFAPLDDATRAVAANLFSVDEAMARLNERMGRGMTFAEALADLGQMASDLVPAATGFQDSLNNIRRSFEETVVRVIGALGGGGDTGLVRGLVWVSGVLDSVGNIMVGVGRGVEDFFQRFRHSMERQLDPVGLWGAVQENIFEPAWSFIMRQIGRAVPGWARSFWEAGQRHVDRIVAAIDNLVETIGRMRLLGRGSPQETTRAAQQRMEIIREAGVVRSNLYEISNAYHFLNEEHRQQLSPDFYERIQGRMTRGERAELQEEMRHLVESQTMEMMRQMLGRLADEFAQQKGLLSAIGDGIDRVNRQPGIRGQVED